MTLYQLDGEQITQDVSLVWIIGYPSDETEE